MGWWGGSDDKTTTTTNLPDWAVPAAQNYLQRSQQVADIPYSGYSGATVAPMNNYQTTGLDARAQRAFQGSPVSDAASTELTRTLSGGYLNSNPYLSNMVDAASADVTRNYNSVIRPQQDALSARSGSFGNSGVNQVITNQANDLGRTLGNISTNIRGTDYANERNRQVGAISQAPAIANQDYFDAQQLISAGDAYRSVDQANLDDTYSRWQSAQNYPKDQLATLGRGLGMNYGSTSSTSLPNNSMNQILGGALAAYGAYRGGGSGGGSGSTK